MALGRLTNLRRLNLDYNMKVTDAGIEALKTLDKLEELRLDSVTVTDAGIGHFRAFPHLKLLNLYHTLVTEPAYETLRGALPGCRIVWDRESSLPIRRGS